MRSRIAKLLIASVLLVCSSGLMGQQKGRLISGNVRSSGDSNPLPGVSIEAVSSRLNSGTQDDGNFYIEIKAQDSVLVFKLAGYRTKELRVGTSYEYQVFLEPENNLTEDRFGKLISKTPILTRCQETGPRGRVDR